MSTGVGVGGDGGGSSESAPPRAADGAPPRGEREHGVSVSCQAGEALDSSGHGRRYEKGAQTDAPPAPPAAGAAVVTAAALSDETPRRPRGHRASTAGSPLVALRGAGGGAGAGEGSGAGSGGGLDDGVGAAALAVAAARATASGALADAPPALSVFVARASTVVLRALDASAMFDVFADYAAEGGGGGRGGHAPDGDAARFTRGGVFVDERWTRGRCVMSLDWSRSQSLIAVGYSRRGAADAAAAGGGVAASLGGDPEGLVLVWSTACVSRPELVLTCESEVRVARFHAFDPALLLAGTRSGQVVAWDARAAAGAPGAGVVGVPPVAVSGFGVALHAHAITGLAFVGTGTAYALVTAAADGTVCTWSGGRLGKPTTTVRLDGPPEAGGGVRRRALHACGRGACTPPPWVSHTMRARHRRRRRARVGSRDRG